MAKALLVQIDREMSDLLSLNLALFINFEVIVKDTIEEAVEILDILPDVNVIIAPDRVEGANIAQGIHNHLTSAGVDIPLLILGHVETLKDEHVMIEHPHHWQEVIKYSAKVMGITPQAMAEFDIGDFYPVPLKYFFRLDKCVCDIYLSIPKNPEKTEFKFIKRIPANENYDRSLLDKWDEYGVENLYIEKGMRLDFGKTVARSIIKELEDASLTIEQKMKVESHAYSFLQQEINDLGISPLTVEMATKTIDSMTTTVKQSKKLAKLLKDLEKNQASYFYKHAILISFVASKIMDLVEWGTKEQVDKLVFVAFFCDITLKKQEHCIVETEEELEALKLPPKEKKAVREHASRAAMLIRSFPQVPMDAETIIQQHHGALNGVGYIEYITNRISPLSLIFILCQEYVNMLLKDANFNQDNALQVLSDKYSKTSFKKAMEAISKLEL